MLKKEYVFLYLTRFCYSLANALIDIYGTVILYKNGFSVSTIFLIYALRFGLMGILTPLSIIFSTRVGIGLSVLIANVIRIIFSYVILFNLTDNIALLILLLALPGAISNPLATVLSTYYVHHTQRGKYNSLRTVCKILGSAIASLLVLYGISSNQVMLLFSIVVLFFMLDFIFTAIVNFKPQKLKANAFKETFSHILKTKDAIKTIYALRTFHVAERLFIPLYLYIVLKDFTLLSTVITISLGIQIILILFSGYFTDKNILIMHNIITFLRVVLTSIFIFVRDKFIVSINKIAFDNMEQIYDMVNISSVENIIKKSPQENCILASTGEMCLCFSEVIIFSIIALIASYDSTYAFLFMFTGGAISAIAINRIITRELRYVMYNEESLNGEKLQDVLKTPEAIAEFIKANEL